MTEHGDWPLAAYLAGELTPQEADLVDQHVMSCDQCWNEVQLARAGQSAAAGSAEAAPDELRRVVAAAFADLAPRQATRASDQPERTTTARPPVLRVRRGLHLAAAVAVLVAVVLGAALVGARIQHSSDVSNKSSSTSTRGRVLDQALAYYRATMSPGGASILSSHAPDLTTLGLHVTAAGTGNLGSQPSVAYAYTDAKSDVILLFTSTSRFHDPALPAGPTSTLRAGGGLTVFTATAHPMLIVGANAELVEQVGRHLT